MNQAVQSLSDDAVDKDSSADSDNLKLVCENMMA